MIPYKIKSFRGGVSDEADKGIAGSFKYGKGLDINKQVDSLTCGSAMTTLDQTIVTDLVQFFVPAANGSTYAFGDTGKIYSISGDPYDAKFTVQYTDTNGKIKGAEQWKDSTGNNYLFWATDTSISRKLLPGDDAWGDVTQNWKTTLNSADWHTMANAGGQLNIANLDSLATIDYSSLAFNALALNVRPGNILKALEERDDYVIMGSYRLDQAEEGYLWSWIVTATSWIQKKQIQAKGVNALISSELILMQAGNDGGLFYSDFKNAIPLHNIPGGGTVNPGGVAIINKLAAFGIYGGSNTGIWTYGRSLKNRPYALNFAYRLARDVAGSSVSTIGAITVVNGQLLASWGTTDGSTSGYGVDGLSSTTYATASYESLEFNADTPESAKNFQTVNLAMNALPSGASVSVKFKMDKATTGGDSSLTGGWRYAVLGDMTTTSYSTTGAIEALFLLGPSYGHTYEVGVELTPNTTVTPEILAIITYLTGESYGYG